MSLINARLFRTSSFRLSILYMALFSLSSMVLIGFLYWATTAVTTRQTDQTIEAEITGLAEQYRANGMIGLTRIIRERSRNQRQSLYLLATPDRTPIAGNISAWPPVETSAGGWLEFDFDRPMGARAARHQARARHLLLAGGFQLLVGRDVQERRDVARVIRVSLIWALALTLGLGLLGGILTSRNLLRRVEIINRTGADIMAGDLGRRVPLDGSDDEFDQLARNLNAMFDQIERLVTGMRQVTENISHDLRSPLNRLRARLEVTLLEDSGREAFRRALEDTIAETDRLINTFNALLSIAQIESGEAPGATVETDLGKLARDAVELYEPVAEGRGQVLSVDGDAGLIVDGNRHLLSQAVVNLIDNAVKYTPEGGRIEVSARRLAGGAIEIAVADSGPGIPEEARDRVLGRFVRLEESRSRPGTGLGLSLVRAVAHLHGAQLTLGDNAPGLRVSLTFAAKEQPPS